MGPNDCAPFFPVPDHIIAYRFVRTGRLWARVGEEAPVAVGAGEIILFPRNERHLLFSTQETDAIDAHELLQPDADGHVARISWGGRGECCTIFCGFLGSAAADPVLLQSLPSMLKIGVEPGPYGQWMESSLRYAAEELHTNSKALGRLAELLFGEAVRRYLEALPPGESGWLAGLGDPAVSRALAFIHRPSSDPPDMALLAREAGLSRSALAERFGALVGEPPIRYWTRWRLRHAANRLRDGKASIGEAAFEAGFGSEAAFSRAFKREYGVPPAAWRRRPERASTTPVPA